MDVTKHRENRAAEVWCRDVAGQQKDVAGHKLRRGLQPVGKIGGEITRFALLGSRVLSRRPYRWPPVLAFVVWECRCWDPGDPCVVMLGE